MAFLPRPFHSRYCQCAVSIRDIEREFYDRELLDAVWQLNPFPGSFDLRLSRLRRYSRGAQDGQSEGTVRAALNLLATGRWIFRHKLNLKNTWPQLAGYKQPLVRCIVCNSVQHCV